MKWINRRVDKWGKVDQMEKWEEVDNINKWDKMDIYEQVLTKHNKTVTNKHKKQTKITVKMYRYYHKY